MRKRDISNAFKRVPLRPDYIAAFCHQFGAKQSGLVGDFMHVWRALPLGYAARPCDLRHVYGSNPTSAQELLCAQPIMVGWGPFSCFLFVEYAIFIEADVGDIPTETVGAGRHARRILFGPDAPNHVQPELERSWGIALGDGFRSRS